MMQFSIFHPSSLTKILYMVFLLFLKMSADTHESEKNKTINLRVIFVSMNTLVDVKLWVK